MRATKSISRQSREREAQGNDSAGNGTYLMNKSAAVNAKVLDIIEKLKEIDVDGETMEYILERVGMDEQMLRQLFLGAPIKEVEILLEERKKIKKDVRIS